jgi:lipopolysaccharide/colanic/teichoic acid biosynthesis glycosyltransferase
MQLLQKLVSARIYLLSLIEAGLAAGCFVAATFLTRPIDASMYLMYEDGALHIGVIAVTFLITSYLLDLYKQIRIRSRTLLILQSLHLIGVIFIVQAALAFIDPALVAPQPIVLAGSGLTLVVIIGWRLFIRPALWTAIGTQRVIFVGSGDAVEKLDDAFRYQATLGTEVMGYLVDPSAETRLPAGAGPVLGPWADLTQIVSQSKPDRVIVGADDLRDRSVLKTLFNLRSAGVTVESAGDAYEAIFGRVYSRGVEPYTVIFRNELGARPGSVALQSIYTNILALAAVVVALPVIIVLAAALKLLRKGPVFTKVGCVGMHGIPFYLYRFRCPADRRDPLTRLLLRFRLDALPEVFNIVRGEMTLIGPRAERTEFSQILDSLIPFYRQRRSVKPGVIGWSQLHCDVQPTEDSLARIEYDLFYLKHISLVLDAYILLRALKWALSDPAEAREAAMLRDAAAPGIR